jgi:hypothetical protein
MNECWSSHLCQLQHLPGFINTGRIEMNTAELLIHAEGFVSKRVSCI